MSGRWAEAAEKSLRLIGRPATVPEILRVIQEEIGLDHRSKQPEQTLRNEIRKNCDTCSHIAPGNAFLIFTEPEKGYYALREWEERKPSSTKQPEESTIAVVSPSLVPEVSPLTDEIFAEEPGFFEGACQSILVNRYERDIRAREACIRYWGTVCVVCSFDFKKIYGELGRGFTHVHHIVPLSQINRDYEVDPIKDLRPVCPNCHAMLHRRKPAMVIEELRELLS